MVDAEPLQRRRRTPGARTPASPSDPERARRRLAAHVAELRREHDLVAPARDRAADEPLVRERPVHVGRVEERHAELERAVDRRDRLGVVAPRRRTRTCPCSRGPAAETSSPCPPSLRVSIPSPVVRSLRMCASRSSASCPRCAGSIAHRLERVRLQYPGAIGRDRSRRGSACAQDHAERRRPRKTAKPRSGTIVTSSTPAAASCARSSAPSRAGRSGRCARRGRAHLAAGARPRRGTSSRPAPRRA